MNQDERVKLRLVTEPMPAHNEIRVCVPPIEYDEVLDCFYVSSSDQATFQHRDLVANLHTKELLDLDPSDVDALLAFQREWGLITTPNRTPLRHDSLGMPNSVITTPVKGMSDEQSFQEAQKLLDGLDARHPGFAHLAKILVTTSTPSHHGMYPFVPRREAEAAVTWLQSTVNELVRFSVDGYDPWAGIDEVNLRSRIDFIDSAIAPYFPRVRLATQKVIDGTTQTPPTRTLPTTIALLVQLVTYIGSEEGYRVCQNPECNAYFVYKRHAQGELVRNRLSAYCSDTCQRRAVAIRQAAHRKERRHELKAERLGKEGR